MLNSLRLENWKSFGAADKKRSTLQLAPLTLLVGPNASGKSNALDALRFLQGAALDYPLGDVLRGRYEGQREVWHPIRGGVAEAAHSGADTFALETSWSFKQGRRTHLIEVSTSDDVSNVHERLRDPLGGLFEARKGSGRVRGNPALRVFRHDRQRSLIGEGTILRASARVKRSLSDVRTALREAVFLDIRASMMRDYRPENGGHLGVSGENVSPVLQSLSDSDLDDVVGWVSELCAPEIEGIEFDRTALREVMMIFVERGGRRTSARSASDGTLRFLGEVVALLTCPPGTLVVLEEPDVGLHPSRIRLLAELLEHVAVDRSIQVIATTHSPTLLAHLSPEALGAVIAFGRDPESGDTICSRLVDLPHYATLRDSRDLEHLVSTGWLERAL